METVRTLLQQYLNLQPAVQTRLLNSLLIILALILLRLVLLWIVNRRFRQDTRALYSW